MFSFSKKNKNKKIKKNTEKQKLTIYFNYLKDSEITLG